MATVAGIKYVSLAEPSGYGVAGRRCLLGLAQSGVPLTWTPMMPNCGGPMHYGPFRGSAVGDSELDPYCNQDIDYDVVIVHTVPEYFPFWVDAFECNPFILPVLRARLADKPGIRLVERAVWDADAQIPFYPVIHTIQNGCALSNPGASSCFLTVDGYHQQYVQTQVMVEAIRLDTYCARQRIGPPDLLCIDVQGAALRALRGLGDYIAGVWAIIIEIEHREVFVGEDLYPAVDAFLVEGGFRQAVKIEREGWFCDYLYLRRAYSS